MRTSLSFSLALGICDNGLSDLLLAHLMEPSMEERITFWQPLA
jgi:hypothetical protein